MNKNPVIVIISSSILFICLFVGCTKTNVNLQSKVTSGKEIFLRLADNQSEDYVTVRADREFAKIVEQKSNGRIKVDVYPAGQLGDEKDAIEQVQFGGIDFIRVSVSTLSVIDKEMGVLILPYIYRDQEHMFKVLDGPIGDNIITGLENFKLTGLCWFDAGARNFYNTKKDIVTPDDLKGLKIRVQENKIMIDMVNALGALPTPMTYGEVYRALQIGVIDGAENNWLSYISSNHYEVAKHITIVEHVRIPEMIVASKISMDNLSKDDQKIIKEAAKEAAKYQRQEWLKDEEEAKKKTADKGVFITKLQTNKTFQEKVKPLYETYGKDYQDLIQSIINTNK
ncbi:MAG: TRAP transporter substrate-binding protein [Clostridiaceae bacterium]|nr:TRAP transporter substrate-binding protein [Clostridiaceae bacterium]